ncbi:MAG: hypothetical protein HY706_11050 [Candidatus Hydrogenedentes bacterium]|nr:hypothetical protein [Candidatus Hydrogenedentota bacterium]
MDVCRDGAMGKVSIEFFRAYLYADGGPTFGIDGPFETFRLEPGFFER